MKKMMMAALATAGMMTATTTAQAAEEQPVRSIDHVIMEEQLGYTVAPLSEFEQNIEEFHTVLANYEERVLGEKATFDQYFYYQRNYILNGERF